MFSARHFARIPCWWLWAFSASSGRGQSRSDLAHGAPWYSRPDCLFGSRAGGRGPFCKVLRAAQGALDLAWIKYEWDDSLERVQYRGQVLQRSKAGLGCMECRGGARYEGHWLNNQVPGPPHHSDLERCLSIPTRQTPPVKLRVFPPLTLRPGVVS